MQFQILVSFFFAYIAAVQASPIGVPELPTDASALVGSIKVPVDVPVNIPVDVRGLPIDDVLSKLPLEVTSVIPYHVLEALTPSVLDALSLEGLQALKNLDLLKNLPEATRNLLVAIPITLPVRRNIPDTLEGVSKTLQGAKDIVVADIPFEVSRAVPGVIGRQINAPVKEAAGAIVDGTAYGVHALTNSAVKILDNRQLSKALPTVPSMEGVAPELKIPEVPTTPTLPLKTRQVSRVPNVDIPKVDDVTGKVSTLKIVRRHLRRQESDCVDAPARRSLEDVSVPPVPALKGVEIPSTPSLPIN